MNWNDWITEKYIAWRGNSTGRDRSISEFARMIGVSQPSMSAWMKKGGKIPRDQKTISALVTFFGDEVYKVIGLPGPDDSFSSFPPDVKSALESAREKIISLGVSGDSPEAEAIINEALKEIGYSRISKEEFGNFAK